MIKYRATTPKIRYTQHDNTKQHDTTQHTTTHSKNINKKCQNETKVMKSEQFSLLRVPIFGTSDLTSGRR